VAGVFCVERCERLVEGCKEYQSANLSNRCAPNHEEIKVSTVTRLDGHAVEEHPEIVPPTLSEDEAIALVDGIRDSLENAWANYASGCAKLVTAFSGRAWLALGLPDWPAFVAHTLDVDHLKIPNAERLEICRILSDGGLKFRDIASATGLGLATIHRALNPVPNGTGRPNIKTPVHVSWTLTKSIDASSRRLADAREVDWTTDPERADLMLDKIMTLREQCDQTEAAITEMRRGAV